MNKKIKLEDITKNITDGKHGDCKNEFNSGYFFISVKDIKAYGLDYKNARQITENEYIETHNRTKFEVGDILLANSGHTIGKMLYAKEHPNISKTTFQKSVAIIKPDNSIVNGKFLYYCLLANVKGLKRTAVGSAQPNLLLRDLRAFEVKVDSNIKTQKQIAKVLSDLDAKIEVNNKINQQLEAMAKTLYDYWFVQFEFPDKNGKPYKSSGGKMVYNDVLKREIPEGWEVKELGDCINIFDNLRIPLSRSEREKRPGNIPYFGATGLMDYVDDYIFNDDYILLAEDGSVMNEKGMPIVQFIWGKTWVNNHAHVIQAKDKSHNEFFYQLMKMIPVILIKTGSIQMKINQENLKKYKVLIPNVELIENFSFSSNDIRKKLINNSEQNQKLSDLRDWLLPMLMNGQATVKPIKQINTKPVIASEEVAWQSLKTADNVTLAAEPQVGYGERESLQMQVVKDVDGAAAIIGAHIVKKLEESNGMGRTKFQKALHLSEYYSEKSLGGLYTKKAAGPHNDSLIKTIEGKFRNMNHVKQSYDVKNGNKHVVYKTTSMISEAENAYKNLPSSYTSKIDEIIEILKPLSLKESEAMSTLYAVWNNRLIQNQPITTPALIKDFYNWSPRKKQEFIDKDIKDALNTMKLNDIVPIGWGDYIS